MQHRLTFNSMPTLKKIAPDFLRFDSVSRHVIRLCGSGF